MTEFNWKWIDLKSNKNNGTNEIYVCALCYSATETVIYERDILLVDNTSRMYVHCATTVHQKRKQKQIKIELKCSTFIEMATNNSRNSAKRNDFFFLYRNDLFLRLKLFFSQAIFRY